MSRDLYPESVWSRFQSPRFVAAQPTGEALATASTPASEEVAELFESDSGHWHWRAHASPWLTAALEVLCELRDNGVDSGTLPSPEELDAALDGLCLPAARRYCAVIVRELWEQATSV